MGDAIIWLAFRGVERKDILERLNLKSATESDSDVFSAALPDQWHLVLGDGLGFMDDANMNRACADCSAVSCYLESHVMVSAAAGWEKGRRIWSVLHDYEEGPNNLESEGELPAAYPAICETLMAKQKAQGNRPRVDYIFDVPIELAAAVAGFHYLRGTSDGYPDLEGLEMAVMPSSPGEWWSRPRPRSWFTKYFG
jgi:hypothetical protein